MMGIPPSEARQLSWWEYQALLTTWNERHNPDSDSPDPPSLEAIERHAERLEKMGLSKRLH